jgi:hypothetical protein
VEIIYDIAIDPIRIANPQNNQVVDHLQVCHSKSSTGKDSLATRQVYGKFDPLHSLQPKRRLDSNHYDPLHLGPSKKPFDLREDKPATTSIQRANFKPPLPNFASEIECPQEREQLPLKELSKSEKYQGASHFNSILKKTISTERWCKFKHCLQRYTSQKMTLNSVIDTLCRYLFEGELEEDEHVRRFEIMSKFGFFISERHDEYFQKVLRRVKPKTIRE